MSKVLTKANLIEALTVASVAIPRKANVAVLTALYDVLPLEQKFCPECGVHLSNGVYCVDDEQHIDGGSTGHSYREARDPAFAAGANVCMGCGTHFGEPVIYPELPAIPIATGTGLKIEKERPEQNGVKRPSIGGKCRAIWDALDAYLDEVGEQPTSKVVKELAADSGWNPNNASIEYYQWRKYNGVKKG